MPSAIQIVRTRVYLHERSCADTSSSVTASTLASYVGYGNVAGFLFNKGIMSAPPAAGHGPPSTTADGTPINPITGIAQQQQTDTASEMTEEEKEREAEKLFVLFDRLEKSGALPPSQNPVRKAISEGKGPAY